MRTWRTIGTERTRFSRCNALVVPCRKHHGGLNQLRGDRPKNLELWTGVGSSKKDPHGVRLLDKVLGMIESLTEQEQMEVQQRLEELAS